MKNWFFFFLMGGATFELIKTQWVKDDAFAILTTTWVIFRFSMFSLLIHQMTFRAIKAISNLLIFRLEQWAMPDDKMLPNLSNYVLKIKLICFMSLIKGLY